MPSCTQTCQCDTPFCNISRDICAIPPGKRARKHFAILSPKVSRDMKSIAAGPLSSHTRIPHFQTVNREQRLECCEPRVTPKKSSCSARRSAIRLAAIAPPKMIARSHFYTPNFLESYRSIQIDYRQRLFWGELISNYRYRIELPEELIAITETDLWEFQQKISHYRYRFSLEFQLISITDTDFGLKTN